MITVLTGENSFAIHHDLQQMVDAFEGTVERVDGADLELKNIPDLLMGVSLFSEKRFIIIRNLSQSKAVWEVFADWIDKVSDDISLILIEPKLDKRTRTYKALQKSATVREHKVWTLKDIKTAERWVEEKAAASSVDLSPELVKLLINRVGVDQWQLSHSIDKLSVFDKVTKDMLCEVIEAQPSENVFDLFETALKGESGRIQTMVATLALTEDPYQVFGLLSSQAFQLAAIAVSRDGDNVAQDMGVHPFVLSRLKRYAGQQGVKGAADIIGIFIASDDAMKTSSVDPWVAIEQALYRLSNSSAKK